MTRGSDAWSPSSGSTTSRTAAASSRKRAPSPRSNHPHICQIHDIGPDYLVLEYIDGQPLQRSGAAPAEALRLALQIASALEEAHRQGILHRDLKPANIMVTGRGGTSDAPSFRIAKLLDFGLAKLVSADADATRTTDGVVSGTAAYMSPEQIQRASLDQRELRSVQRSVSCCTKC